MLHEHIQNGFKILLLKGWGAVCNFRLLCFTENNLDAMPKKYNLLVQSFP